MATIGKSTLVVSFDSSRFTRLGRETLRRAHHRMGPSNSALVFLMLPLKILLQFQDADDALRQLWGPRLYGRLLNLCPEEMMHVRQLVGLWMVEAAESDQMMLFPSVAAGLETDSEHCDIAQRIFEELFNLDAIVPDKYRIEDFGKWMDQMGKAPHDIEPGIGADRIPEQKAEALGEHIGAVAPHAKVNIMLSRPRRISGRARRGQRPKCPCEIAGRHTSNDSCIPGDCPYCDSRHKYMGDCDPLTGECHCGGNTDCRCTCYRGYGLHSFRCRHNNLATLPRPIFPGLPDLTPVALDQSLLPRALRRAARIAPAELEAIFSGERDPVPEGEEDDDEEMDEEDDDEEMDVRSERSDLSMSPAAAAAQRALERQREEEDDQG